jgi:hypothetical protein
MTSTIVALWWAFLVVAVLVTLADVYLLLRVVNLSRQIRTLSAKVLPAAVGMVENTAVGEALGRTAQLVGALANKAGNVAGLTGVLAQRLSQGGKSTC